jgi:hypothetical protein
MTKSFLAAVSALAVLLLNPTAADAKADYQKEIWPILKENCLKCHKAAYKDPKTGRTKKPKGDFRIDSPQEIMKGSEDGDAIVPGKPDKSPLYVLTTLGEDHDDIMPPKGDPLTKAQQELLKKWIAEGADFGTFKPTPKDLADDGDGHKKAEYKKTKLDILSEGVKPASDASMETLRKAGALAMPLAQNTNLVRVDFSQAGDKISDVEIAGVKSVAGQVTSLNLARTKVSDNGLKAVADLKLLTRLHLENTGVGDAGLKHLSGLEHLEYLNLYGTQVGDAGVAQLAGMKNLKKLYVWQSKVTENGVKALQAKAPNLQITAGWKPTAAAVVATAAGAKKSVFDAGSCCAKAEGGGKACGHGCCKEAAGKGLVCKKCNPKTKETKLTSAGGDGGLKALAAKFKAGSCCDKAFKNGGKACGHGCCKTAAAKNEVCKKCN